MWNNSLWLFLHLGHASFPTLAATGSDWYTGVFQALHTDAMGNDETDHPHPDSRLTTGTLVALIGSPFHAMNYESDYVHTDKIDITKPTGRTVLASHNR